MKMKNKLFIILMVLCVIVMIVCGIAIVFADPGVDVNTGGSSFTYTGHLILEADNYLGGYTVVGFNSVPSNGEIIIPDTYNDKDINIIGNGLDPLTNVNELEYLVLGKNVMLVNDWALSTANNLLSLEIPKEVLDYSSISVSNCGLPLDPSMYYQFNVRTKIDWSAYGGVRQDLDPTADATVLAYYEQSASDFYNYILSFSVILVGVDYREFSEYDLDAFNFAYYNSLCECVTTNMTWPDFEYMICYDSKIMLGFYKY